jgi:hypothetical protein
MPQNFLSCEREQVLLMPPSLRDWLPEDHLAWFILATVEELDLGLSTRHIAQMVMGAQRTIRR